MGWIALVSGGLIAILGTGMALFGTKKDGARAELKELKRKLSSEGTKRKPD